MKKICNFFVSHSHLLSAWTPHIQSCLWLCLATCGGVGKRLQSSWELNRFWIHFWEQMSYFPLTGIIVYLIQLFWGFNERITIKHLAQGLAGGKWSILVVNKYIFKFPIQIPLKYNYLLLFLSSKLGCSLILLACGCSWTISSSFTLYTDGIAPRNSEAAIVQRALVMDSEIFCVWRAVTCFLSLIFSPSSVLEKKNEDKLSTCLLGSQHIIDILQIIVNSPHLKFLEKEVWFGFLLFPM